MSLLIVQFRSCNNFNINLDNIVKVLREFDFDIKAIDQIYGPPSFTSIDFLFNSENEARKAYTQMCKIFGVNVLCHV